MSFRRARLFDIIDPQRKLLRCGVCERRCILRPGARGLCGNYTNIDGVLYHLGYGRLSAVESRPIEIKPLFHYWPNSTALTFSNWGCNFYCPWCQNSAISFRRPESEDPVTEPRELIKRAVLNGDEGFSASFNEPSTHFDYLVDLFTEAGKHGFYAMMVTNGYLTLRALETLVTDAGVDGWSIDIKGCPSMSKNILPGVDHEVVFRNARRILDLGGHVEMVFLVVPKVNDFDECVEWI
ncbi:MAG: radical SAM protein, partial [Thermoprotei archaeon]